MSRLWFLSVRYWRRRAGRGATTVLGMALGVALVVSVGLINGSILSAYVRLTEALAGRAQLEVRALNSAGIDEAGLALAREVPGVALAVPLLEHRSFLFDGDRSVPLLLRGVDPTRDPRVRPLPLTEGRPLMGSDERAMLLAAPLGRSLGVKPGDRLELLTPEGVVAYRIAGVFDGRDPLDAPQSRVALLPLRAMQRDFSQGARRIGGIDVTLRPDADWQAVEDALRDAFSGAAFVQRPLEEAERLAELTRGVRFLLLLAGLMSLVAAAYLIGNNVLAAVFERQHDLGVIRALGVGRGTVQLWLLGEVVALSGVGAVLGGALGVGAARVLGGSVSAHLVTQVPVVPDIGVDPAVLLVGLLVGVGSALLAAWPAVRWVARGPMPLGRQAPQRDGGAAGPPRGALLLGMGASLIGGLVVQQLAQPSRLGTLVSLVLVLGALLALASCLPALISRLGASLQTWQGSPLWLRLAADSLRQHRRRTGAVAASLMITVAILVGVFGMVQSYRSSVSAWVEEMFGWDLMVSSRTQGLRAEVPLSEAIGKELAAYPGVALASPERFTVVAYGNAAVSLYAIDAASATRLGRLAVVEGVPLERLSKLLSGARHIAVSTSLALRHGLEVGDVLDLSTPTGPVPYRVIALVHDPGAATGAAYLDRAVYIDDWGDRRVDSYALRLEPGVDAAALAAALQERFERRFPLQVVSAATFRESVDRMVTETFGLSQGLVVTAVLMALFGLMNAGLIGVWQLRRQLAVLRALGAPLGLLSRALLAEAWLTAALGGAVGVLMGTVLSAVLLRGAQLSSTLVVSWSWPLGGYALVAALALLGGLAAGYPPARAAARTQLAEALRNG